MCVCTDEIGIPFCVTVDFDSPVDGKVCAHDSLALAFSALFCLVSTNRCFEIVSCVCERAFTPDVPAIGDHP